MFSDLSRVIIPAAASFWIGIALTPIVTHYLFIHKAWKKRPGKTALDGTAAQEFNRLHQVQEVRAPRMGGIVIWASTLLTIVGIALIAALVPSTGFSRLNFLSRGQTWLPLAALLVGAFIGLVDDLLMIRPNAEGLPLRLRLVFVVIVSSLIGWWFWDKLGVHLINIPFGNPFDVGVYIIPFFVFVSLCLYASGVIDGIDGLSGGVFASIFGAYAVIAFALQEFDLAAFCTALVGGLLAFLWFNVPPARFYMSDTGTMGLTLTLAVVAFMTDNLGGGVGVFVLPIIGILLVITVLSNVGQMFWKRVLGRKLLRIAPLHHHFEAIGWPGSKVVMRYWILSVVFAFAGVLLALSAIYTI
ncbi:MAG: mraY [Candidatus Kaiserbacteria bacterium]|nr:mraY [Candidatus Kaiserbacteria bacterium]